MDIILHLQRPCFTCADYPLKAGQSWVGQKRSVARRLCRFWQRLSGTFVPDLVCPAWAKTCDLKRGHRKSDDNP